MPALLLPIWPARILSVKTLAAFKRGLLSLPELLHIRSLTAAHRCKTKEWHAAISSVSSSANESGSGEKEGKEAVCMSKPRGETEKE